MSNKLLFIFVQYYFINQIVLIPLYVAGYITIRKRKPDYTLYDFTGKIFLPMLWLTFVLLIVLFVIWHIYVIYHNHL